MRTGHGITLFGAGLVVMGALFMPWVRFEWAEVSALGCFVPTGQILGALALLAVGTAALAMTRRRMRVLATANLLITTCAVAWLIGAYLSRGSWFDLASAEVVTMAGGYSAAWWGVAAMTLGTLTSLASEPTLERGRPILRVAMLFEDAVLDQRELLMPEEVAEGQASHDDLMTEVSAALGFQVPLFRATHEGYAMGIDPSLSGEVVLGRCGERMSLQEFVGTGDPGEAVDGVPFRTLEAGDWGTVQLDGAVRVAFHVAAPRQTATGIRRVGRLAFDESVTAAILAGGVSQGVFLVWVTLAWQGHLIQPL